MTGDEHPIVEAVQGVVAQEERKNIIERVTRDKAQQARNGKYLPGAAPYGYQFVYEKRDRVERVCGLEIVPAQAAVVRDIFQHLTEGNTATGTAAWLNRRGIPTPKGGNGWRHTSIVSIVRNPTMKVSPDALRFQASRNAQTRKKSAPPG